MIYELTITQSYFDQQVINRFNYLQTGTLLGASGAFALLTAFGAFPVSVTFPNDTVMGAWQDIVDPELIYVGALCKALYDDPTDFFDIAYATGVVGQEAGTLPMSPTAAIGFRSSRTRIDIARGTKRLAGVDETFVDDGGVINSSAAAVIATLADLMSDDLNYSGGGSSANFEPIICGKEKYTAPSGKDAYRYYGTLTEQMAHIAQNIVWSGYSTIRTQTSRQYGHGR